MPDENRLLLHGTPNEVPGATALGNLQQIWLYNKNQRLQVGPRQRINDLHSAALTAGPSLSTAFRALNTIETFGIDDAILIDTFFATFGISETLAPGSQPSIVSGGIGISTVLAGGSGAGTYEPLQQFVVNQSVIPPATAANGLGLVCVFVSPNQPLYFPIHELTKNAGIAALSSTYPSVLQFYSQVLIDNPTAATPTLYQTTTIKYRHVYGVAQEN